MRTKHEVLTAEEVLRKCCKQDYEVDKYLTKLSLCRSAREIAEWVVKPIVTSGSIIKDDACKDDFYMPLANYVEEKNGTKIARSTLYNNVVSVTHTAAKVRARNDIDVKRNQFKNGCDATIVTNSDGYLNCHLVIDFTVKNSSMLEKLRPFLEYVANNFKDKEPNDGIDYCLDAFYDASCAIPIYRVLINSILHFLRPSRVASIEFDCAEVDLSQVIEILEEIPTDAKAKINISLNNELCGAKTVGEFRQMLEVNRLC